MDEDDPVRLQVIAQLYKEQCDHGRHTETQRHALSGMLLALAGALLAAMAALDFSVESLPLALLVVFVGGLGLRFVAIYARKWDDASARRNHYRELLEEHATIPEATAPEGRGHLRNLWSVVFALVIALGLICSALIARSSQSELRQIWDDLSN